MNTPILPAIVPDLEPSPDRTLKIEATGDFWKGVLKPKIRLMGHWLDRAGFKPGHRVQVTLIAPGVIELRCPEFVSPFQPASTPPQFP